MAGGPADGGAAAAGLVGAAVKGAAGGVPEAGASKGVAVTDAENGVAVVGAANGVAVTGAAPGAAAPPGANGGVAVEGMGMAGLAAAAGRSCEVMTFALPGGTAAAVPSVVGTCANRGFSAAARLRAAIACGLFELKGGGSVGFLT